MPVWGGAYYASMALCLAAIAWTLCRREWTWLGLYVALGCMLAGLAKHLAWFRMVWDPQYAVNPEPYGLIYWPLGLEWGLLAAILGMVQFAAMIGAIRKPTPWLTTALVGSGLFQTVIGLAWGISTWLIKGQPPTFIWGETALPAWAGVPLLILTFDLPSLIAIPWGLLRYSRLQQSSAVAILERFSLLLGIVLLGMAVLVAAIIAASARIVELAGQNADKTQMVVGGFAAAVIALMCFAIFDFRSKFLLPALTLMERDGPDLSPRNLKTGALWQPFADAINRREQQADQYLKALQSSQSNLQAFLNNAPFVMFVTDLEGNFVLTNNYTNPDMEPDENVKHHEAGHNESEYATPEQAALNKEMYEEILATGKATQRESALERLTGPH